MKQFAWAGIMFSNTWLQSDLISKPGVILVTLCFQFKYESDYPH